MLEMNEELSLQKMLNEEDNSIIEMLTNEIKELILLNIPNKIIKNLTEIKSEVQLLLYKFNMLLKNYKNNQLLESELITEKYNPKCKVIKEISENKLEKLKKKSEPKIEIEMIKNNSQLTLDSKQNKTIPENKNSEASIFLQSNNEESFIYDKNSIPVIDLDEYFKLIEDEIANYDNIKLEKIEPIKVEFKKTLNEKSSKSNLNEDFPKKVNKELPNNIDEIELNRISISEIEKLMKRPYSLNAESNVIHMSNVHRRTKYNHILELIQLVLKEKSPSSNIRVELFKYGYMRSQGFIYMNSVEEAGLIIEKLNGYLLFGRPLILEFSEKGRIKSSKKNNLNS